MRYWIIAIVTMIWAPAWSLETDYYPARFDEGNLHYKNAAYDTASTIYLEIANAGYASPDLYYNLGNSLYKTGQFAEAILYYERANRLDPGNPDIGFNLEMANKQIVDEIEPIPTLFFAQWWKQFYLSFSMNNWTWTTIILAILIALSLFVFRTSQSSQTKRMYFLGGIFSTVLFVLVFLAARSHHRFVNNDREAIIFESSITLKSEPAINSADLFVLHEGTKVEIKRIENEWIYISIPDGNEGWLPKSSIVVI